MEFEEKEEIMSETQEKIRVLVNALLEKEKLGQLSPETIQELKCIL